VSLPAERTAVLRAFAKFAPIKSPVDTFEFLFESGSVRSHVAASAYARDPSISFVMTLGELSNNLLVAVVDDGVKLVARGLEAGHGRHTVSAGAEGQPSPMIRNAE
jgi:hypothetical protein